MASLSGVPPLPLDTGRGRPYPLGPLSRRGSPTTTRAMAKSQFKAGGPTRGRRRVRKIGMGSGKYLLARKEARKGVSVQPQAAEKPESKG